MKKLDIGYWTRVAHVYLYMRTEIRHEWQERVAYIPEQRARTKKKPKKQMCAFERRRNWRTARMASTGFDLQATAIRDLFAAVRRKIIDWT